MNAHAQSAFSALLREWRHASGLSQLGLATLAGSSQRHISFLESGRANPSPVMIFALGEAMDVPLRDRNEMLLAAGFAPRYAERSLDDDEMEPVRAAVDRLLAVHEPYPALVLDRLHNIRAANAAAGKLVGFLFGGAPPDPTLSGNALRALLHPRGCRDAIVDWEDVAAVLLRRLRAETTAAGAPDEATALLDELSGYEGIPADWKRRTALDWRLPMLSTTFEVADTRFSLFSTITMLGAPFDVTLQEIRIESFFPADAAARRFFEG